MKGWLSRDEEGRRRGLREDGLSGLRQTERDGGLTRCKWAWQAMRGVAEV